MSGKALADVDESVIRAVLRDEYATAVARLNPLSGGLDHDARTFRVDRDGESPVVLRVGARDPADAATLVPRFLRGIGVEAVVAPVPASDGRLVVRRHDLAWTISPYIDGPDGWAHGMAMTDWAALGAAVGAIHGAGLPPELAGLLCQDDFDAAAYAASVHRYDSGFSGVPPRSEPFVTAWGAYRRTLTAMLDQLAVLGHRLRAHPRPNVVCHGDLHPGNVLVAADGVHIIDWDEVLLAPRERDYIFVPELRARGAPGSSAAKGEAFLAAHYPVTPVEVDWIALTYYRCERVLQDVIVEAGRALDAMPEDDNGPTVWLHHVFQPDGEAAAAIATAQHLPPQLNRLGGET